MPFNVPGDIVLLRGTTGHDAAQEFLDNISQFNRSQQATIFPLWEDNYLRCRLKNSKMFDADTIDRLLPKPGSWNLVRATTHSGEEDFCLVWSQLDLLRYAAEATQPKPNTEHVYHYLEVSDLLLPDELVNKTNWKDYILLAHDPGPGTKINIMLNGIKSLARLVSEHQASEEQRNRFQHISSCLDFGNDPDLIYFRPVSRHISCDNLKRMIVIAAKMGKAHVFDQRYRAEACESSYQRSSMELEEYIQRLDSLSVGQCLNQDGMRTTYSHIWSGHDKTYIPEVVANAGVVHPRYFVSWAQIVEILRF